MRLPRLRRPRWLPGWLSNPPRLLRLTVASALSVSVAVLATLAVVSTVSSYRQAQSALHTRDDAAARASARISALTDQIALLNDRSEVNTERIGELVAETQALEEQVRQMGGRPVTTPTTTTTTTTTTMVANPVPAAPGSPSPAPTPSTTTTTAPPSPPTTTPCTTLPFVVVCR